MNTASERELFPDDLPSSEWVEFPADGFGDDVTGVIYRTDKAPCCGVPVGGVGTGCLDVDVRGVYGFSSLFNPVSEFPFNPDWVQPRKPASAEPILGLAVGDTTWVLTTQEILDGGELPWCTEPHFFSRWRGEEPRQEHVHCPKIEDVRPATDIRYWGHYPCADLVYELDGPVGVSMRAWAPFLPGDSPGSNIPALMFEVRLENLTGGRQSGTIALNFPGPDDQEARASEFTRTRVDEDLHGILVSSVGDVQYALGVLGDKSVRIGGGLNAKPAAWSKIATELPQPTFREVRGVRTSDDGSASVAVDFDLEGDDGTTVQFLLAWYAPIWEGAEKKEQLMVGHEHGTRWINSEWAGTKNFYTHAYAGRYASALDVARRMARDHKSLLKRVLAWQEVVYAEKELPGWLRDSLVNNLHLIAEDGYWALPRPPLGDWAHPDGVFGLNESTRGCPHTECIPCDWYGNLPIVYFFPDLARSTLRNFMEFQREDGAIPFEIGMIGQPPDFATPGYFWQISLNGTCYIEMVDRLWRATGDAEVLQEFYESTKRCNTFTINLKTGPGGVISMPEIGGMEWFEFGEWAGMCSHMGGLRLAQLRMVERMAEEMGDHEYAEQCREWFADGSRAMEEELWADGYYLNFYDKEANNKSDDVMGYQLDGQWATDFHGLAEAFRIDRVATTLETIKRTNVALTPDIGAANFVRPDGSTLPEDSAVAKYGQYAMFVAEVVVLAMTYIYAGDEDFGIELARKHWENIVCSQGHPWDHPNLVDGKTGERLFGTDYYQTMMLWALPAAILGQDIDDFCAPDGFIDRIRAAATGDASSASPETR